MGYTRCLIPYVWSLMKKSYFVYIVSSTRNGMLYIGFTGDLKRRIFEHKNGLIDGFTKKHQIQYLVYFEETDSVIDGIRREKQLKGWIREKKIALIETDNPKWDDLSVWL